MRIELQDPKNNSSYGYTFELRKITPVEMWNRIEKTIKETIEEDRNAVSK